MPFTAMAGMIAVRSIATADEVDDGGTERIALQIDLHRRRYMVVPGQICEPRHAPIYSHERGGKSGSRPLQIGGFELGDGNKERKAGSGPADQVHVIPCALV